MSETTHVPVSPGGTLRPLRGLATTVTVLLGLNAVLNLVEAGWALRDPHYATHTATGLLLFKADRTVFLVTAVAFLVWLYRARVNAEALCVARHRHGRALVVLSWIIPVVQWWWPKQIVDDIWRASDPRTPAQTTDLAVVAKPGLVRAWWTPWVTSSILELLPTLVRFTRARLGVSTHQLSAQLPALAPAITFLDILAALLAIGVVRRITAFQQARITQAAGMP